MLDVDSPGGTVAGVADLAAEIRVLGLAGMFKPGTWRTLARVLDEERPDLIVTVNQIATVAIRAALMPLVERYEEWIKQQAGVAGLNAQQQATAEQLLADAGVMVIEHADFDGVERLSACLGSDILSTFDSPETAVLGTCASIEEIMIGEDKVIKFSGCQRNEACTIVLRGSGSHILDEAERSLHDAICVLVAAIKNHKTIYGGGNSEMRMAAAVDELAKSMAGKQAIAAEAFARALRQLPTIIAENCGYDASDRKSTRLNSSHT